MTQTTDHPGVIAPPPLLFLGTLTLALLIDRLGIRTPLGLDPGWRYGMAFSLVSVGAALIGAALGGFRRAGTRPEPWQPSTAIVATGIYAHTRNPMYLGMASAYAGLGVGFDSWLALAFLLPLLLVMEFAVVRREERYLSEKFGGGYESYRSRVRRWI